MSRDLAICLGSRYAVDTIICIVTYEDHGGYHTIQSLPIVQRISHSLQGGQAAAQHAGHEVVGRLLPDVVV